MRLVGADSSIHSPVVTDSTPSSHLPLVKCQGHVYASSWFCVLSSRLSCQTLSVSSVFVSRESVQGTVHACFALRIARESRVALELGSLLWMEFGVV